jgi:hypothetical protein
MKSFVAGVIVGLLILILIKIDSNTIPPAAATQQVK